MKTKSKKSPKPKRGLIKNVQIDFDKRQIKCEGKIVLEGASIDGECDILPFTNQICGSR